MSINMISLLGPTQDPGKPLKAPIVFHDEFVGSSCVGEEEGIVDLTDNSGGTGDDTLVAIGGSFNQTEIRNNFADVAAKISEIVAAMGRTGSNFSTVANRATWLVSTETYAPATSAVALDAADGGWVNLRSPGSSGNRVSAQVNGEAFKMDYDRKMLFKARMRCTLATSDWFVGIMDSTTDAHADATAGNQECIGFGGTGSTALDIAVGNADSATAFTATAATFTAAEFFDIAWEWDGRHTIRYYVDGTMVGSHTDTGSRPFPIGVTMSPVMCVESNGVAETIVMDHILVVNER